MKCILIFLEKTFFFECAYPIFTPFIEQMIRKRNNANRIHWRTQKDDIEINSTQRSKPKICLPFITMNLIVCSRKCCDSSEKINFHSVVAKMRKMKWKEMQEKQTRHLSIGLIKISAMIYRWSWSVSVEIATVVVSLKGLRRNAHAHARTIPFNRWNVQWKW